MTTYTAIPAAETARLAELAAAGDLDAIHELVAAHQQPERTATETYAATAEAVDAAYRTALPIARAIVQAPTVERAHRLAQQRPVRGRVLAALGDLLGVELHGSLGDRQRQLVQHSIGQAMSSAVLSTPSLPDGRQDRETIAARVAAWRQRKLAQVVDG